MRHFAGLAIQTLALAICLSAAPCQFGKARNADRAADGIVTETSDNSFARDVWRSGRPTVVYYYAHGCIPCVALGPHVKKLAARYAGQIDFLSLDRGWSAERVRHYGVPVVPTLVFYSGEREVIRQVGMPEHDTDDSLASFVEAGMRGLKPEGVRRSRP